jgi:outer membrane biosynthesis protein TonB
MGRLSAPFLALALAAVAALGLVACGSGEEADLLPGSTASEINSNLDQVEQLASDGDCEGAQLAAQEVSAQVEALGGVDQRLKQALREGATRLNEVVADCEEPVSEEAVPTIEEAEEPEEVEKKEKPEKSKPEKEAEEPVEEEETPALPPQAEGEANGQEDQEDDAPPVEPGGGAPSGGVGPATPAGSD